MRDRFNLAFAVLLLAAVAAVQLARARLHSQSPWQGGGFGMFSTADSPDGRFTRCILSGTSGEFRVPVPASLQSAATQLEVAPTEAGLLDLGHVLLSLEWVRDESSRSPYRVLGREEPPVPAERMLEVRKVRVEVWRTRLSADGTKLEAELIRSCEVEP
ncbi:MAG: hypothetical protein K8T20_13460 [Planctomycetes bacterium]|nr:hypothetical protein [Planctomycetota bacterium]